MKKLLVDASKLLLQASIKTTGKNIPSFGSKPPIRNSTCTKSLLFMPTGMDALPWLVLTTFTAGVGSGLIFIALPSMMADAADEHEYNYHERQEGLFFAGLGFAGKAAAGMGLLIGGIALENVLHFPKEVGRQIRRLDFADALDSAKFPVGGGQAPRHVDQAHVAEHDKGWHAARLGQFAPHGAQALE